ncbi:peptidoglycan/LPS O-acetylase OafA/YrhL/lysophospholipase L1-like esterase [Microbacterium keratanolyticum]|uniref:Acyltransferase n=1 Tax=Microbacterium keratanolyticum TaxID=67574 RepID=A0A9W6HRZ5_9MICO|nr:acyltransferase family protein [Microbacterium keratanolyticum]MBM7469465.1 peptidoglycan/LPS O-acetylase OafA/YrhL/lysophospholipase L1-like esterase [Microbacterium keratanolyticum]GLK01544.1 acyltransferase [Microbacterium keratanolyticum]
MPSLRPARYPGLDGLRAIAVALVVIYHLFPGSPLRSGFVGVDVFFVVSGFLITSLLLQSSPAGRLGSRASLVDFWTRRARRLLPALGLVVTTCATAAWFIGGDVLVDLGRQVLGAATFSYNWVSLTSGADYFAATSPELFRNLWSLAVEEQFYVLWPLLLPLLLMVRRSGARIALALVAAAGSAWWMAQLAAAGDVTRGYYGTDSHAFGILLGIALAITGLGRIEHEWMLRPAARRSAAVLGVAGLAAIATSALLPETPDAATFPGSLLLASLGTIGVVVASVWPQARFGIRLDIAPLRWIGDRSYGIYLWHWPVLVLVVAATSGGSVDLRVPPTAAAVTLVLTLVLAALSYRFIEMPIRRRGLRASIRSLVRAFGGRPARRFAALTISSVIILSIAGTVVSITTAPAESSAAATIRAGQRALEQATATPSPAPTESLTGGLPGAPSPTPAPSSDGSDMIAIGDSVMLASAPALLARFPGIAVDAEVSRSMWTGTEIVSALASGGDLRETVVVGLGTNGAIDDEALDQIAASISPRRDLILVNAYAPRDWIPGVNEQLAAFAAAHVGVVVADWSAAIAPRPDLLAEDLVHPGDAGGELFADAVDQAIRDVTVERQEARKREKAAASLLEEARDALRQLAG